MSVDTRTPRFDEPPALNMTKVPSDPAQVIVTHASFRVQLPSAAVPRRAAAGADTLRIPVVGAVAGAQTVARRKAPVVWSGRSAPGEAGATTGLLEAVRESGSGGAATQTIPRVTTAPPGGAPGGPGGPGVPGAPGDDIPAPRAGGPQTQLLPRMPVVASADDEAAEERAAAERERRAAGPLDPDAQAARQAYYPGHRMNLGVVLLPLRVFLGLISVFAGMGKLGDPVYFDGGERGSMVKWLTSLNPWAVAEPLRDFALSHPVGAGLTVAFLQIVVGVLTIFGLWQRLAAVFGALLSVALLVTVSWKSVPVYDTPDIIYLAAWSPLVIAGAPVYSLDGRLAGRAWRLLGPRAELWELRNWVLRRGTIYATVVIGLTLLLGSMIGSMVRSSEMISVPGPGAPRNEQYGETLPTVPGERAAEDGGKREERGPRRDPAASASPSPRAESPAGADDETTSGTTDRPSQSTGAATGQPSQSQGAGEAPPQEQEPAPAPADPTGGTTGEAPAAPAPAPDTSGGNDGSSADGGSTGQNPGGDDDRGSLVGGLLG
ncbi:DoxX family membrane protein [Streptomyces sp. NPDC060194]|uniref:DoxX family membrane protein n=1 Tax=Streptomyces sp. NPDC060194 TaxID=3347069 RepID=UPI00364D1A59